MRDYTDVDTNLQEKATITIAQELVKEYEDITLPLALKIAEGEITLDKVLDVMAARKEDDRQAQAIYEAAMKLEYGLASLAKKKFEGELIYDHTEKRWYRFTDGNWRKDNTNSVRLDVANGILSELLSARSHFITGRGDKSTVKETLEMAESIMYRKHGINNVLDLLSSELGITADEWDNDPMLLGVENGVINLKTGEFRAAKPDDYIKKLCPVEWKGFDAPCERFTRFMYEIFAEDEQLVYFMNRLLGYALTGLTVEHKLPILIGPDGRNGKSVLLRILRETLGKYMSAVPAEALLSGTQNPGAASPYIMMLQGLRLAHCSETNEGLILNSGTVKSLTGGDRLIGRPLYGEPVEFKPSHKIMLISNYKPHVNADDEAVWERILLIEFTQRFLDDPEGPGEHKSDPYLLEKLEQEKSGILAWLVMGCQAWQQVGLNPPETVLFYTEAYRQEEDVLGHYVEQRCELGEELEVKASALYADYKTWSIDNGFKPFNNATFGRRISKRFRKVRRNDGWYYQGVRISVYELIEDIGNGKI